MPIILGRDLIAFRAGRRSPRRILHSKAIDVSEPHNLSPQLLATFLELKARGSQVSQHVMLFLVGSN
jgi:hypothetical protein